MAGDACTDFSVLIDGKQISNSMAEELVKKPKYRPSSTKLEIVDEEGLRHLAKNKSWKQNVKFWHHRGNSRNVKKH